MGWVFAQIREQGSEHFSGSEESPTIICQDLMQTTPQIIRSCAGHFPRVIVHVH